MTSPGAPIATALVRYTDMDGTHIDVQSCTYTIVHECSVHFMHAYEWAHREYDWTASAAAALIQRRQHTRMSRGIIHTPLYDFARHVSTDQKHIFALCTNIDGAGGRGAAYSQTLPPAERCLIIHPSPGAYGPSLHNTRTHAHTKHFNIRKLELFRATIRELHTLVYYICT